jgi:hypothetical protein
MASLKAPEELAFEGERISLTFRLVATFMTPDKRLWGQGARNKSKEDSLLANSKMEHIGKSSDTVSLDADVESLSAASAASVPPPPPPPKGAAAAPEDQSMQELVMLKAFSAENRQPDFDWDAEYGSGFDCINLHILNKVDETGINDTKVEGKVSMQGCSTSIVNDP